MEHCCNLHGGLGQNIPNDELCELQVRRIKGPLATQGPNKSFESAQVICNTSHVLDNLKEVFQKRSKAFRGGRKRAEADKRIDVFRIARELKTAKVHDPNTKWAAFVQFKDPLE